MVGLKGWLGCWIWLVQLCDWWGWCGWLVWWVQWGLVGLGGGGGLGGLVGLSLGVVSGALSQAVSGCFPPISGLDYALLSNFLFLIKRGPKNTKTGKQHKTKHPQKSNPPHDCNLNGRTTVFQHCRMQKSRKTKNCLKCGAHPPCCIVQETIFLFLSLSKYH